MRHRHWLLVAAAAALFYSIVLIRTNWFMRLLATYGDSDIHAGTIIAVTCILSWLTLEVVHVRLASRGSCSCGYSLKGVKCPECGRDLGQS